MIKNQVHYILLCSLLAACGKSRLCTDKPSLKLDQLDESKKLMLHYESYNNFYVNMPRYFTPNGDGVNDFFEPEFFGYLETYKIVISNGCRDLYETTDFQASWDGSVDREKLIDGEYTYAVTVLWQDNVDLKFGGKFSLVTK